MHYRRLGRTDIEVSEICLGTMTFGEQNTESEAHQQLDYAVDQGVNFIDAAEMYPVPPKAETYGRTESYIGTWLERRPRDKLIIATKVAGPGGHLAHVPGSPYRLNEKHIRRAVEDSLKRLRTDYVDLYQVHWPDRPTNRFGQLGYVHEEDPDAVPIEETLGALARLVEEGKVRYLGVSNETPWGVMQYLNAAEKLGLPRIVSIQNPYSLLNRSFEVGLTEVAIREDVSLLAYSPLAFGVLSGKYLGGARPPGSRVTLFDRFKRYSAPHVEAIVALYVDVANRHGLDPAQMAIAFLLTRPYLASAIIGATKIEQLKTDIAAADLKLSAEVIAEIEQIHLQHSNPCP